MGSMTGNCRFYNIIGIHVQCNIALIQFFSLTLCHSFYKYNLLDINRTLGKMLLVLPLVAVYLCIDDAVFSIGGVWLLG